MNTKTKFTVPIFSAIFLILLFQNCKKAVVPLPKENPDIHSAALVTTTEFPTNTYSFSEIVEGQDETDTKIRKIKLHLSASLVEICKNQEITNWLYNQLHNTYNNEIKFSDLFAEFPEALEIVETHADPLNHLTNTSYADLEAELDYMDYQYWGAIYLTNDGSADVAYKPIISPGLDIIDDEENNRPDITMGWKLDDNNDITQVLLWEDLANSTNAPVFAVSLMSKLSVPTPDEPEEGTSAAISDAINSRMKIHKIQIGAHYDKTNNNEYCLTGYWTSNWGNGKYMRYGCYDANNISGNKPKDHWTLIKDIPKSGIWAVYDIDKYFLRVHHLFELDNNKRVFFNTFERDWFAGAKNLGAVNWGSSMKMEGNMEYSHEYYQFHPWNSSFWQNRVNVPVVSSGYTAWFWGSAPGAAGKGYVGMQIVAPCY
jgi:hypothetical protein